MHLKMIKKSKQENKREGKVLERKKTKWHVRNGMLRKEGRERNMNGNKWKKNERWKERSERKKQRQRRIKTWKKETKKKKGQVKVISKKEQKNKWTLIKFERIKR